MTPRKTLAELVSDRGEAYEGPDPGPSANGHHQADNRRGDAPFDLIIPPDMAAWPAPPAKEVFHGLAGEIVRLIEPQTEADPVAVLTQILVMFGNAIGRTPHWTVEEDQHYGNLFLVLVGETGRGRKGTSKGRALKAFSALLDDWAGKCVRSGLSSGEGMIHAVRDPEYALHNVKQKGRVTDQQRVKVDEGVSDKRLLVIETEFARPLRAMRRDGNTLSAILREGFDSGSLSSMTRKGLRATGAHISMIGHVTAEELKKEIGNVELVNGLANRILWAMTRRPRSLPLGGQPVHLGTVAGLMADAVDRAKSVGLVGLHPDAAALWTSEIHPRLDRTIPGAIGKVLNRWDVMIRRLAMLYALLDFCDVVWPQHLQAAAALWDYCESSARAIFGNSSGDKLADDILAALKAAGHWLTQSDIHGLLGRNRSAADIARALGTLQHAGLVVCERMPAGGAGRPPLRWKIAESTKKTN